MKRASFIILGAAMVCFLSASCIRTNGDDEYEKTSIVKVGDAIPDFTVTGSDSSIFSSSQLSGKSVLIFFFQTTCKDCQKVLPVINELWNDAAGNDDYVVLSINRGQTVQVVDKYFDDNGYTMERYFDPVRETYNKFATSYVPRLYIAGPDGKVRWMAVEKLPSNANTADKLMALMEAALEK